MDLNIDIAIVALFLVFTMIIGFGHGRKVQTIQDYALGGRDFSTAALVATIVATWLGGSSFFLDLSNVYSDGVNYIVPVYGEVISFIIMAYLFIPKMEDYLGKISIAEAMGDTYGKNIRLIVALAGIVGSLGGIAVQFKVFGILLNHFLNISATEGLIIGASVVTLYSSFGGIRSVTFTDIFQLFTFGFAIPLVGVIIWNNAYFDGVPLFNTNYHSKFDIGQLLSFENPDLFSILALFLYFAIPGMKPVIFQRVSMGQNTDNIKRAFLISAALVFAITATTQWIPFLIFKIDPNLNNKELFGYILDHYTYIGFKGVVISGIIAMVMSTADSSINTSSILFAHDICKPLGFQRANSLFVSRIFALILGIAGISLAMSTDNLLDIVLKANSFYMPIVTIPFMLTILGFRGSSKSVLIGMTAGFITVLLWKFLGIKANSIFCAMIINLIFTLVSSYLIDESFAWDRKSPRRSEGGESLLQKIYNIFKYKANRNNFYQFVSSQSPNNELSYISLGVYFIIYTITSMYATQTELTKPDGQFMLLIYQIMIVTGVILAMYPIWPKLLAPEIKLKIAKFIWPFAIFFMMSFLNVYLIMVNKFASIQFAVFTINILIVALLLRWHTAFLFMISGFYLATKFFYSYHFDTMFDITLGSPAFLVIYLLVLTTSTIVIFIKPQQEYQEETEAKVEVLEGELQDLDSTITALQNKEIQYQSEISSLNEAVDHYSERVADQAKEIERLGATAQKILNNVNHELRLPVGNVMNFAEMLYEGLGNYSQEQLKELTDEVYQNSTRLSTMILNMLDLATLDVKKVGLVKSTENFSELVRDRVKICRNIYLQGKPIDFKLIIEPEILISIDPNYMRQVVDNLVINAINFSEKGTVEIEVRRNDDAVVMTLRDQGKGIPREELFDIFKPFKMGSNSECQSQGRGVGLALCKSAVEAHGGSILAESPGGIGALFTIILMR